MRIVFLGDETSAAGYRLAGVDARRVENGDEATAFEAARREAPLVLVAAGIAEQIPPAQWRAAVAAVTPLCVVVPDLVRGVPMPDLTLRLKRQLGLVDDDR